MCVCARVCVCVCVCLCVCEFHGNAMHDMWSISQISTVMGLEALVKQELEALGYPDAIAKNGRVEFRGDEAAIARCVLTLFIPVICLALLSLV